MEYGIVELGRAEVITKMAEDDGTVLALLRIVKGMYSLVYVFMYILYDIVLMY